MGFANGTRSSVRQFFSRFFPAIVLALAACPSLAQTPPAPSTFIEPTDGSILEPGRAIRWTARPGALAYYLYVGTAPGLKDLIDSRETQQTQWPSHGLPAGTTVHARIHTKYESGWVSTSISFSVRPLAVFTSPSGERATINPDTRLEWTTVQDAQAYFLYVGSAPGLNDLVNTGEIQSTFHDAVGLPAGRTVHARLHTKHGGVWRHVDLTLDVAPVATFVTPRDTEQEFDPGTPLRWRQVEGAQAYYLYVGTARGRRDLVDSRETTATSWPATFIPAGETVFARLHTKYGGVWRYTDISFRVAPKAIFIEPATDGIELDPRAPLIWTDVPAAQAYYLYVGTAPGLKDLLDSGETGELSFDISSLPRGRVLHATLFTKFGGTWRQAQRSFRIRPVATLLDRPDAPSRIDTRVPLRWQGVQGAEAYYLYVGTSAGAKDLINSRETQALEFPIASLPAGQLVHVRLFTKHGGVWRYVESTLQTRPVAYLDGPVAGTSILQAGTPLTWQPYSGASRYYVYVGSTPGAKDISSSGEISGSEFVMPPHHAAAIVSDRPVYLRLYSLVDGRWEFVDYTLEFRVAAQLNFPKNHAANVDVTAVRMTWNQVSGAAGYRLQLGTTRGAADVLATDDVVSLEQRTGALPGGVTLHARLWTEVAGEWRYTDSTFTTRPAAAFLNPRHGALGVDFSHPIEWSAVEGADMYRVAMGTVPGGLDLLDTGLTTDTSVGATPTLLASTGIVYARLWTRHQGKWRFSDSIFSRTSDPQFASMTWESGEDAFRARDAFRWTPVPLADSYRLRLGTAPGASDLHDSGRIRTVRRLVDGLPSGVALHGSLETILIDGTVSRDEFQFTVADPVIDFEDRWNLALWATAEVRDMARNGNTPLPNSLLLDSARIQLRDSAFCTTYAMTEVELARQINLGLEARILNVCLNTNSYDCHTLIEVLNPLTQRWQVLDPTFGIAVRRQDDGEWATALELFAAVREGDFAALDYVGLTDQDLGFADSYYLDYPLLFAHVLNPGSATLLAQVDSVLPYYHLTGIDSVAQSGLYALRCLEGSANVSINVTGADGALSVDGNGVAIVPCNSGVEDLSHVFRATTITPADGSPAFEIAIPKRFEFD
jgi:hypothetical protein